MKLYDLAGSEDNRRTSPYCWRIRLALAHKAVPFHTEPWRGVEKDKIAFTGQRQARIVTILTCKTLYSHSSRPYRLYRYLY